MFYDKFFGIFNRLRKRDANHKRFRDVSRSIAHQKKHGLLEQLEPRIALSAVPFSGDSGGERPDGWFVVSLDANEDNLYLRATQEINNSGLVVPNIEYSENPSFASPGAIAHDQSRYRDILVTAGTVANLNSDIVNGSSPTFRTDPEIDSGVVLATADLASDVSSIVLDDTTDITVGMGVSGAGVPAGTTVLAVDSAVEVTLSTQVTLEQDTVLTFGGNGWQLPVSANAYEIVPGTVVGTLTLFHRGGAATTGFGARYLHDHHDGNANNGVDAVFGAGLTLEATVTLPGDPGDDGTAGEPNKVDIKGNINYNGTISFEFFKADSDTERFTPNGGSQTNLFYHTPIVPDGPSAVTLASGRDLNLGLQVDLPGPDSSIDILSPIQSAAVTNDVVLAASTVAVDAPINSNGSFLASSTDPGVDGRIRAGGARSTIIESFQTVTSIKATQIGINVANDTRTTVRDRGELKIASSGSWESTGGSLAVRAAQTDISLAGNVKANNQSYLFRTNSEEEPYRFTTTGAGVLTGQTLDITLDNEDAFATTSSVVHPVAIRVAHPTPTAPGAVISMRISGEGDEDPVSSVRGSSFKIDLQAQGAIDLDASVRAGAGFNVSSPDNINLNASVRSYGDVVLASAGGDITGSAELSTVDGLIDVSATNVDLRGALQVLNTSYDQTVDDISISATGGAVQFDGGASSANRIVIAQNSTDGLDGVTATGALVARQLVVTADGNVDLQTDADVVEVTSGAAVTVSEENDAVFEVSSRGLTTLSAAGVDPVVDGQAGTALRASVRDTDNIIVSAPRGSIEVLAVTSEDLTVGNLSSLVSFTADNTLGAGNVLIRSTQGDMVVLDAPEAGVGSLTSRAVSGANLPGVFQYNNPGEVPSTITGSTNQSLNDLFDAELLADPAVDIFPGFGGTEGEDLRVRDVVLLVNQTNAHENGLYQIMDLGSDISPWVLRRSGLADQTTNFPVNSRVAILDGDSAGDSYRVNSYTNVLDQTPLRVSVGNARSENEVQVRTATDAILSGSYATPQNDGVLLATITGTVPDLIAGGVAVNDGDLVLVRFGVEGDGFATALDSSSTSNGIYRATIDTENSWVLTRWNPSEDGVTAVDEAVVVVADGFSRTSSTGQTYSIQYDGLGIADVLITNDNARLELGSFDPRDQVDFVVSTNGDTNRSPGSLGRMLSLVQGNQAEDFNGEAISQRIRFGNVLGGPDGITGRIPLQQELPEITRPFVLDASNRYDLTVDAELPITIDGSRITSTREGTFVVDQEVNGFVFSSAASGTTGVTSPEDATRSVLRSVRMGGFEAGAAVQLNSVSNVLVESMEIGLNENGDSQAVKYGIQVRGGSALTGPVTLLNNQVYSASIPGTIAEPLRGAGIRIESPEGGTEADYVQIVGGQVGSASGSNTVGIQVVTDGDGSSISTGTTSGDFDSRVGVLIGANPLPTSLEVQLTQNKASIDIGSDVWGLYGKDIYLGQSVTGAGVPSDTEVAFIERFDDDDDGAFDRTQVTLSNRATLTSVATPVTFSPVPNQDLRTIVSNNFNGITLASGKSRVVNTGVSDNVLNGVVIGVEALPAVAPPLEVKLGDGLTEASFSRELAAEANIDDLTIKLQSAVPVFEGMEISASSGNIKSGSTVESVDETANSIKLSSPLEGFLAEGSSVDFQGINPRLRSASSNSIVSNGQYGILFKESIHFLYEDVNDNQVLDPPATVTATAESVSNKQLVVLDDTTGIEPGMSVAGTGIPECTTVLKIDSSTQITLSAQVTLSQGTALDFTSDEDINENGKLDAVVVLQGNYLGKEHGQVTEPGNLRANYFAEDACLGAHQSFVRLAERDTNFSPVATQYDFGDIFNNVNSETIVPLVRTEAPSALTWSPGRQLIRLEWTAPETNQSTGIIGGYRIQITGPTRNGIVTEFIDLDSTATRADIAEFSGESLTDGEEYEISVAALLEDATGADLPGLNKVSEFSNMVTAIPAQPAGEPARRPVTRF